MSAIWNLINSQNYVFVEQSRFPRLDPDENVCIIRTMVELMKVNKPIRNIWFI